jgi:hypothetical protein
MSQPSDLTTIRGLVSRTRARIRTQGALEGGTTALVLAAAATAAVVFLIRTRAIESGVGIALLVGCVAIVAAGAVAGALRRLDDERVARRLDRASNLADRLSTAIAFERALVIDKTLDDDGREFMAAAIRDAARAAPRADIKAAAPITAPRDLKVAGLFVAIAAAIALLRIPLPDYTPALTGAFPNVGPPGVEVRIEGKNLLSGVARPPHAGLPGTELVAGAAGVEPVAPAAPIEPWVPKGVSAFLGAELDGKQMKAGIPVDIEGWSATAVKVRIPADAPLGKTTLTLYLNGKYTNPVPFTVVDPKDKAFHKEDAAELEQDEMAYARSLLEDLKNQAKQDDVKELDDFAAKIEALLDQAERGEITKEKLLEELQKAEESLAEGADPKQQEIDKALEETGKELQKSQETKELGKALEQGDLEKAKEEMEKLAEKLENGQLDDKQKQDVAKAMEQAAQQFDKKDKQQEQKAQQQQEQLEEQVRKLQKEKDQAKTEEQKQDAERRLQKKQRELKQLQKEQQQKQESEQRRALKRLHKDLEKVAEDLKQKKDPNQSKDQQEQQEQQQEQQASRNMKDAAQETGKVDQDRRKQQSQKKVASQMEDLREAMRRAKRRGNKGGQDPFGKNGKNQDFISRARGQKGQGQAWKPGQGQKGQGQGQGKDGQGDGEGKDGQGQGQDPGGQQWGTGHDENLVGDPTAKSGNTSDQDLQGKQGKGPSRRETILAAAQKGFASRKYQDVYADYKRIVEEVMRTEKVPSSYKYYVKRYFTKIKPHSMD